MGTGGSMAVTSSKWQREFGTTYTVFDLEDWQQNYGGGLPLTASINAVPEPGTLGLLAAGALGIATLRKRPQPRTTLAGQTTNTGSIPVCLCWQATADAPSADRGPVVSLPQGRRPPSAHSMPWTHGYPGTYP